ncbi:hypothetical protein Tdes44962_MAKER01109 [Teratosphaeria destructans]|uniref:Uncharacterized protein n=1 Tax=Teratosphaeria destructans TaxID=418781 RepID=A0A9W7SIK2_9PEZI|nr:hypothetical protein Tdes44962_MAKER01109 [Teratosphaeria destructans]
MRLTAICRGFLLLRLAWSLPPPTQHVPTLPPTPAVFEDELLETHLETRGKTGDIANFCLKKLGIGSSRRPPQVPLDTRIDDALEVEVDTYERSDPPFETFSPIVGSNEVEYQAFNHVPAATPNSRGVLFLRNNGRRTRRVSLIRGARLGTAGPLYTCIATYEVNPLSTSEAFEFPMSSLHSFALQLED